MSHSLPDITLALTTYFPRQWAAQRFAACERAIPTWAANLQYSGRIGVHWVDDGSEAEDTVGWVADLMRHHVPWAWQATRRNRAGLGASLNAVFAEASGPVLYAADDWQLTMPQNLDCWVRLLESPQFNIGAVRLGMLHPGVTGSMEQGPGCWFLRLEPHNVVCGLLRPSLISQEFFRIYGPWPEGVSALAVEDEMNNRRYCPMQRANPKLPGIALGLTEPWQHVDSVDLGEIRPGGV